MKEVRTLSAFGFVAQSLKLNPPSTQSYSSLQLYAKASKQQVIWLQKPPAAICPKTRQRNTRAQKTW